jgi:hypothetical protein
VSNIFHRRDDGKPITTVQTRLNYTCILWITWHSNLIFIRSRDSPSGFEIPYYDVEADHRTIKHHAENFGRNFKCLYKYHTISLICFLFFKDPPIARTPSSPTHDGPSDFSNPLHTIGRSLNQTIRLSSLAFMIHTLALGRSDPPVQGL